MTRFRLKDGRPCRLRLSSSGPHRFGGRGTYKGILPRGSDTPLDLLLLLDLADDSCPIESDDSVRYLPLYYPLKYGYGGAELQYAIRSDDEIEILYMSNEQPDHPDEQYVRVAELPESPAEILPLSYEEARAVAFAGGYYQPNAEDRAILKELDRDHPMISIGGYRRLPRNAGDVTCRNPKCEFFGRRVRVEILASLPPVPVNGSDDFWYEYQGGYLEFYFCVCHYCTTVIALNVSG